MQSKLYRTLLVPLDGSPFSEQALPLALSIAQATGAALEVVHVYNPSELPMSSGAPTAEVEEKRDRQTYLDAIVDRLTAEGKIKAGATLLVGHEVEALYEHALGRSVDLVVMTTHGRGPLSRFWLGSVADRLMRWLPIPILLLRPRETEPIADQRPAFHHVLVPLDGSEAAECILEPAVALGQAMNARFTLMRVTEPPMGSAGPAHGPPPRLFSTSLYAQTAQLRERAQAEALRYLEEVSKRLRSGGVPVDIRVVQGPHTISAILEFADSQDADLIALANPSAKPGETSRELLGRTADKVVRGATVPVLVYYTT